MGIQGLLPLLKSTMVPIHVKDLKGCSVAVDTYSWLHKGALSCSRELCKGLPTSRHIDYCMHKVNLLRHHGVKPILVFDGGLLPMKIEQENKRGRARKENLARAIEHESDGNFAAAYECYQKSVDISPLMAHELIQILKQENVSYVVAPYEADAQMTFLAVTGQVDAVITEDSDLIPFGCPRIIFKMDKFGLAVEFQYSRLLKNKELSFAGFTKQMLLEMCILSGCDYLQSLSGMGLKRAHALIKRFKSYDKVIKHLRYSTVSVPPHYEESFKKAILTFQHQRVYDTITEDIVHLLNISDDLGEDLDFLGPSIPQDIAKGIAEGNLDPFTQSPFQVSNVSPQLVRNSDSHLKSCKTDSQRKKLDLPVQKNLLTKYFCFASVEAKSKFRVPRVSPKQPSQTDNLSSNLDIPLANDPACEANTLSTSSPESQDSDRVSPPNNSVSDNKSAPRVSVSFESGSNADDVISGKINPEPIIQNPSRNSMHKPSVLSRKEYVYENTGDVTEGKTRTDTRKVIVRSSYFKHKEVRKDDPDDKQDTPFVEDEACNATVNTHYKIPAQGAVSGRSCFPGTTGKRKTIPDDTAQTDSVNLKHMRTETSQCDNGHCDPDIDKTVTEVKTDVGKFGSDISHLSRYSDIAEKSVERFASLISPFKCPTSGSRASGLRAPLKEVRNTCSDRSTVAVDLSRFAYVPSNNKSAVKSCKF